MSFYSLSPDRCDFRVNDQLANTTNLSSLLRKQKYFIEMIDSLEPAGNLQPREAKVQSKYLDQFHEKFTSNQNEIINLVEEFADQVEISQNVLRKVCRIQTKFEEIFLDSQFKKLKSLIDEIDLIESKNDLGAIEAETLHNHVSLLYDAIVKNQSKIETYISGPAFDDQLRISSEILQKVIAVQIKLKRIFAAVPAASVPEGVSSSDEKAQVKSLESVSPVPEDFSSVDVDAVVDTQIKSLGSRSYLNGKFEKLVRSENEIYAEILRNLDHPPKIAGSIHLRPYVDISYGSFRYDKGNVEKLCLEFSHDLRKVNEVSERVERAVKNYRLYCEGKVTKQNLNYISSMMKARGQKW